jgi:ribosomal protein S12 methylthiotransferase accessory factor
VLQRDGNGLTFRALDRGAEVHLPEQVADGATRDALAALRSAGVEVIVKVGSTDLGLPNVYVVGSAPGDDLVTATACGEAVHPDRSVALRKAVLEFASARARKRFMHGPLDAVRATAPAGYLEDALQVLDPAQEEQRVLDATVHWLQAGPSPDGSGDDGSAIWRRLQQTVFSRRSRTPFDALPTTDVTAADLPSDVAGRLAAQGLEVLVADLSPLPDASQRDGSVRGGPGVHAAKVIVPGTEVETVAYGRIGERNVRRLLDEGRDDLVRVGDGPGGWSRVHLTAAAQERLGGPAWLDRRRLAELTEDLLPLYREPSRHVAQLALR